MADKNQIAEKMDNAQTTAKCPGASNTTQMYNFLAYLFQNEVLQEHLDHIQSMELPRDGDKGVIDGLSLMKKYIDQANIDPLTDLSADFAQLFLKTEHTNLPSSTHPFESVYTSSTGLIMQEARDNVAKLYKRYHLKVREDLAVPEDHIGIELEFVAYLNELKLYSKIPERKSDNPSPLLVKKIFLEQHLLNWIPRFCTDIALQAGTTFYQGLARLTESFLQEEYRTTLLAIKMQSSRVTPHRQDHGFAASL